MNVPALVAGCRDDLRRLRRRFHTYPELSLQESGTIAAICAELDRFGIPHREIEKGGVIATVEGALPAKRCCCAQTWTRCPCRKASVT